MWDTVIGEGDGERGQVSLQEAIEFREASYRYPDTDSDVIKDVFITIPRGKSIAFVGLLEPERPL